MITFKEYFLLEGMKTPAELKQEQIYFIINHQNDTRIQISMYKRPQKFMFSGQLMKYKNLWVFHIQSKENKLGNVYAHKGYGPVMYDMAMELASKYGEGLVTPISIGVGYPSNESVNVYKYYYNNRSDIQKTPLDYEKYGFEKPESLLDTSKTKQEERPSYDDDDGYWDRYDDDSDDDSDDDDSDDRIKLYEQPWLTTLYVKSNPTILNQLEANNMIRYTNKKEPISSPFGVHSNDETNVINKRTEKQNYYITHFMRIYSLPRKNAERLYNDLIKMKIIHLDKKSGLPRLKEPLIPHDVGKHVNINKYKN